MAFWISLSSLVIVLGMLAAAKFRRLPAEGESASSEQMPPDQA